MGKAAEILKIVDTPLQLAALALLVFYGITKALIATNHWKPSDTIVKLVLNRTFTIGLVTFIISAGGPLIEHWFDQDDLINGSVYAQDGSIIQDATVTVPPVGPQPVHLNGSFEIRVSGHDRRDKYLVIASANGFKPETKTVQRPNFGSIDLQLQSQPIHTVREIKPDLAVGVFYGQPFIVVTVQAMSPNGSQAWITDVSATMKTGNELTLSLFPQSITTQGILGPYLPVSGPVPINPGSQTNVRFLMAPNSDIIELFQEIVALPAYVNGAPPCVRSSPTAPNKLTDEAFSLAQSFSDERFIWMKGDWTLQLKISAGDQQDSFIKVFSLSQEDVKELRDSIRLVKSCQAANGTFPLAQDVAVSNFLMR